MMYLSLLASLYIFYFHYKELEFVFDEEYKNGRRILKISETKNIANALGVEINELFKSD